MKSELAEAMIRNFPLFCYHHIPKYGDFLNVLLFRKIFGHDIYFLYRTALAEVPPDVRVFMGVGTLIGYIFPEHFIKGRKITFLGTGAVARVRSV